MFVAAAIPALGGLRVRRAIALDDFAFCAGSEYTPYCTGDCSCLAYTLTSQVNYPSPDACLRRFLADGGQIPAIGSATDGNPD